jgi:hypothetical protein
MHKSLNIGGNLQSHVFTRKELEFEISPKNKNLNIQMSLASPSLSKRLSPKNISLCDKVSETSSPAAYTKYFPTSTRVNNENSKIKDFPLNTSNLLSARASGSSQKKIEFPSYYGKQDLHSIGQYQSVGGGGSNATTKVGVTHSKIGNSKYGGSNNTAIAPGNSTSSTTGGYSSNNQQSSLKNSNAQSTLNSKIFDIYKPKPEYTSSPVSHATKNRYERRNSPSNNSKEKSLVFSSLDQAHLHNKFTRPLDTTDDHSSLSRRYEDPLLNHTEKLLNFSKKLLLSGYNSESQQNSNNNSKLSNSRDLSKISPSGNDGASRSGFNSFVSQRAEYKPENGKYSSILNNLQANTTTSRAIDHSASTVDSSGLGAASELLKNYYSGKLQSDVEKKRETGVTKSSPSTKINNFINTLADSMVDNERVDKYSRFLFSDNDGPGNISNSYSQINSHGTPNNNNNHNINNNNNSNTNSMVVINNNSYLNQTLPNNITGNIESNEVTDRDAQMNVIGLDSQSHPLKKKRYQISILSYGSLEDEIEGEQAKSEEYIEEKGDEKGDYENELGGVLKKTRKVLRNWEKKEKLWIKEREVYLKKICDLEQLVALLQRKGKNRGGDEWQAERN